MSVVLVIAAQWVVVTVVAFFIHSMLKISCPLEFIQLFSSHRPGECPVWAPECGRVSPPRSLAECRKRRLNPGSFVLLCFVLFTYSRLCLVSVLSVFLICLLSCIFQHEPTWMALYSLIVLMCCLETTQWLARWITWMSRTYCLHG